MAAMLSSLRIKADPCKFEGSPVIGPCFEMFSVVFSCSSVDENVTRPVQWF